MLTPRGAEARTRVRRLPSNKLQLPHRRERAVLVTLQNRLTPGRGASIQRPGASGCDHPSIPRAVVPKVKTHMMHVRILVPAGLLAVALLSGCSGGKAGDAANRGPFETTLI